MRPLTVALVTSLKSHVLLIDDEESVMMLR